MPIHSFTAKIKVRSYELDSFGHVNNANFLNYLEKARGDFLEENGLSFSCFDEWQSWPVIASIHMDYKYPAFFSDILSIRIDLSKLGKSSLIFDYIIKNQNNKIISTASTTLVFVNNNGKPMAIPEQYVSLFR